MKNMNKLNKKTIELNKEEFINNVIESGNLCYTIGNGKMINTIKEGNTLIAYTYNYQNDSEIEEISKIIDDRLSQQ